MTRPAPGMRSGGLSQGLILGAAFACAAVVLAFGAVRDPNRPPPVEIGVLSPAAEPGHAGSLSCAACHPAETRAWLGSQHARAMQPAGPETVAGDFDDARAAHFGTRARFFRNDGRFMVETEGADGKPAAFVVDYAFGLEPLQQYLTTFPDGRVQVLPFAWVTTPAEGGGRRWIHLHPDEPVPPGDPLHWTSPGQNWNFMCADCHSTAVRKGYDAATDRFATTFSEMSVGCEACHGKAAGHVAWATADRSAATPHKGFASVAPKRPMPDWTPDAATGSPARGVSRPVGDEVETCGTCHARRGRLAEDHRPGKPLTDSFRPVFLTPDLFEADGQMRDEVFNYSSFQQSKMYAKGVVCSDCHDPHGGKLKASGAEVCAQCHVPDTFARAEHTGHAPGPNAPDCIACHMPKRTYMVVDVRHDHGFRVPRPDLSVSFGFPNTCNDCHRDKPATWAARAVERLHGPIRKGFQTYAPAFHAAAVDDPAARDLLLRVAADVDTPALARATALLFLRGRPAAAVDAALRDALSDPDPMVRIAALEAHEGRPAEERRARARALWSDPVRAVRLQALALAPEGPAPDAEVAEKQAFAVTAAEYVASLQFNADRPEARADLARFHRRQGKRAEAEREYLAALALGFTIGPRVDLADLYRETGREGEAEALLRRTVAEAPDAPAPRHALGLLLIRTKRYEEASDFLRRATELDPTQPRYAFVYAAALEAQGRAAEARIVLEKAAAARPADIDLITALLRHALAGRDLERALPLAEHLTGLQPDDASAARLAARLKAARDASRR